MVIKGLIILSCLFMATCSNRGSSVSGNKETENPFPSDVYGDSLIGKELTNLRSLELHEEPEGKLMASFDLSERFICIAGERQGDWLRLDYAIIKKGEGEPIRLYGWTRWRSGDTLLFKITGAGFPVISPYDENAVYGATTSPASYPGGKAAIEEHIRKEVQKRYPITARHNDIQCGLLVSFIVEKDGTMSNFEIVHPCSISEDPVLNRQMDSAAIECVKSLPYRWQPAIEELAFHKKVVRAKQIAPVLFKLR